LITATVGTVEHVLLVGDDQVEFSVEVPSLTLVIEQEELAIEMPSSAFPVYGGRVLGISGALGVGSDT